MTIIQRTPDIRITVRMERTLAPTPSGNASGGGEVPTGDVRCTGWLAPIISTAPDHVLVVTTLGEGLTEIHSEYYDEASGIYYGGFEGSLWTGVPALLDEGGNARAIPAEGFVCTELQINTTYYDEFPGRSFIALAPGGTWTAEWDSATVDPLYAASGHYVVITGGTLLLKVVSTDTSADALETLTARAFDGTTQIAELIFRAHRIAA